MSGNIKSRDMEWVDLSNLWYNNINTRVNCFYTAFDDAQKAINQVTSQGDIGSLSIGITMEDIEILNEKRRKVVSFCNAIHYEVSELIDNPFSISMSNIACQAFDLDPSNIKVKTGSFLGISRNTSLTSLISSSITDDALKSDFKSKCKSLDIDEPSLTLQEAIKEAIFWENEFKRSKECKEIAENIFTIEVRANWEKLTDMERKSIIEQYIEELGKVFGDGKQIITQVVYDASGYGYSTGNGKISINDLFITSPNKNYSIDKVIDTLTHESRHEYQAEVRREPDKYEIPQILLTEWNATYISSKSGYSKYYEQEVERDARAFAAKSRP